MHEMDVRAGPGHSLGVQELGMAWAALDCFQLVAIGQRMGGSEIPTYRYTKVHSQGTHPDTQYRGLHPLIHRVESRVHTQSHRSVYV